MADPITLADIYALFQASQAEADRRFAEPGDTVTLTSDSGGDRQWSIYLLTPGRTLCCNSKAT